MRRNLARPLHFKSRPYPQLPIFFSGRHPNKKVALGLMPLAIQWQWVTAFTNQRCYRFATDWKAGCAAEERPTLGVHWYLLLSDWNTGACVLWPRPLCQVRDDMLPLPSPHTHSYAPLPFLGGTFFSAYIWDSKSNFYFRFYCVLLCIIIAVGSSSGIVISSSF